MEIASPPNELAVFAADERGLTVNRGPSSRDLYDAIVRPIEPLLARAREVVFVPDRPLVGVAFAALLDRARQRHLIESIAVATAESASSLERMPVLKPSRAVSVSLPTAGMAALPEREAETATLRTIYAGAQSLEANRDACRVDVTDIEAPTLVITSFDDRFALARIRVPDGGRVALQHTEQPLIINDDNTHFMLHYLVSGRIPDGPVWIPDEKCTGRGRGPVSLNVGCSNSTFP